MSRLMAAFECAAAFRSKVGVAPELTVWTAWMLEIARQPPECTAATTQQQESSSDG